MEICKVVVLRWNEVEIVQVTNDDGNEVGEVRMANNSTDHVLWASSAGTNQLLGHDHILPSERIE